jgi:hypothetical protein
VFCEDDKTRQYVILGARQIIWLQQMHKNNCAGLAISRRFAPLWLHRRFVFAPLLAKPVRYIRSRSYQFLRTLRPEVGGTKENPKIAHGSLESAGDTFAAALPIGAIRL